MSQNRNRAVWERIKSRYSTNEPLTYIRSILAKMTLDEIVELLDLNTVDIVRDDGSVEQEQLLPDDVWINSNYPCETGEKFPGCSITKPYVIFIQHTVPSGGDNFVGIRPDSVKVYLTSQHTLGFMFESTGSDDKQLIEDLVEIASDDYKTDFNKKLEIIDKIIEARELYNSLLSIRPEHNVLTALQSKLPNSVSRRIRNFTTPRTNRRGRGRGGSRRRSMKRGTRTRRR